MRRVFADAFWYIALANAKDSAHRRAVDLAKTIDCPVVTTYWVLAEVADAFAAHAARPFVARNIADAFGHPSNPVLVDSNELFHAGLDLYRRRTDKAWSLTDCISFEAMRREDISEALTADRHFEQAGFVALLK